MSFLIKSRWVKLVIAVALILLIIVVIGVAKLKVEARKNFVAQKNELFNNPLSPVFNQKDYDVSIIEFSDYNCSYCKIAHETVKQLLKEDKKIRLIYKEFPILGHLSVELATVAIAVNIISPDSYFKFQNALMTSSVKNQDEAIEIAVNIGIDKNQLATTLVNKRLEIEAQIAANIKLGKMIGLYGAPGFVIGEETTFGATDIDTMKRMIADQRKKQNQ